MTVVLLVGLDLGHLHDVVLVLKRKQLPNKQIRSTNYSLPVCVLPVVRQHVCICLIQFLISQHRRFCYCPRSSELRLYDRKKLDATRHIQKRGLERFLSLRYFIQS